MFPFLISQVPDHQVREELLDLPDLLVRAVCKGLLVLRVNVAKLDHPVRNRSSKVQTMSACL